MVGTCSALGGGSGGLHETWGEKVSTTYHYLHNYITIVVAAAAIVRNIYLLQVFQTLEKLS
jgi:hypothetical protein